MKSSPTKKKKSAEERSACGQRLGDAARLASNANELFDEEIAAFVGINRTDGRCMDLIDFHTRVTAGELAQAASLTTGAVTTAVDRLVRAGLAVRERGLEDRRKVYIELSEDGKRLLRALYHPYKAGWMREGTAFTDEAVVIMTQYFTISRRLSLGFVESLRALQLPANASLAQRIAEAEKLADWRPPPAEPEPKG